MRGPQICWISGSLISDENWANIPLAKLQQLGSIPIHPLALPLVFELRQSYKGQGVEIFPYEMERKSFTKFPSLVLCMLNNQLLIMKCDHKFRRKSSWRVSVRSVTEVMLRWVSFTTTEQLKTSGLITALNIHCKNPTTAKYRWLINKTWTHMGGKGSLNLIVLKLVEHLRVLSNESKGESRGKEWGGLWCKSKTDPIGYRRSS